MVTLLYLQSECETGAVLFRSRENAKLSTLAAAEEILARLADNEPETVLGPKAICVLDKVMLYIQAILLHVTVLLLYMCVCATFIKHKLFLYYFN